MPAAIGQAILAFLGSIFARVAADKILSWVAIKLFLTFLFVAIVPIILNNFAYDIIEIVMNKANAQAAGGASLNGAMTFTGFMGWLIECFRIPEALSLLVSALCLRLALSMIPFVRLVG